MVGSVRGSVFFLVSILLLAVEGSVVRAQPNSTSAALQQLGLTWETARINREAMKVLGDDGGLASPLFNLLHDRWWLIPAHTEALREGKEKLLDSLGWAITAGSLRAGTAVARSAAGPGKKGFTPHGQEGGENPLVAAIERIYQETGHPLGLQERQRLKKEVAVVPEEMARNVARLIHAALEAVHWRDLAFRHVSNLQEIVSREEQVDLYDLGPDYAGYDLIFQVDYAALFSGAIDLGYALDEAVPHLAQADVSTPASTSLSTGFSFRWNSPLGLILLNCQKENDRYEPEPYLILIDCGGDDTYAGGGGASFAVPVSLLIDLAGNDVYAGDKGLFGSGQFGYGFLVDLAGDDSYTIDKKGLGFGRYGVGILKDQQGNDRYAADSLAQGAGAMGIGVLLDGQGNDSYTAFRFSQGFGFTRGCGLLVDGEGDDRYHANDEEIRYPSAQTPDHNASFCQGAATGYRSDDGHSLAGGAGILLDGGGNDSYSAGVFAQGAGYWYGMGLLVDLAGDDSYQGVWYVQGSGAHFALGVLRDFAGQDRYQATHNMAQGAGHDLSLGFLLDDAGNDRYHASGLALGAGNDNGIGVFVDRAGDDVYTAAGSALGFARIGDFPAGLRHHLLCFGLFLDLGGQDVYPVSFDRAGNDRRWFHKNGGELGAGVDEVYPAFSFPRF